MSSTRLLSCLILSALATVAPVSAQGSALECPVRKPHLFGASHGTLVVSQQGVEYRTTDKNDARHWTYEQIKQVQVLSPKRIALRTYEDRGWTHLWTDRTYEFEADKGPFTPELSAALLAFTSRPVVTAVLPPVAGSPRYRVPVKHVRGRKGTEGELLLYENALVYKTGRPDASRYWRFRDLASAYAPNPFRLEVLAYEGGAGDTRAFNFQLQTDLPAGFYDALWSALNPPAPLRQPTGR